MFDIFVNGVLPIFAIGAVGYVLGKRGTFDFGMAIAINKFVMFVALPTLAFKLLAGTSLAEFDFFFLGGFLFTELVMYGAAFVISRYFFGADVKEAVLLGLAIALVNHILFVLPIAVILFGDAAVTPIISIVTMDGIIIFSGTMILMDVLATKDGSIAETISKIGRNPPLVATVLGLLVGYFGLPIPGSVDTFLTFTGSTAAPCLLFAVGVILSQPQEDTRPMLPLVITGLKLIVFPVLAWSILAGILDLAPDTRTSAMMVAAAPCGVMAFMLALNYGVRVDAIAKAILYSSIGSLLTVTLAASL
jgi:malonate transporter and related proteins